jgi:putative transposase
MKDKQPFDFKRFKEEAMEGLYNGKKMGVTDGVFAPMLKHLLESMLEGELDYHLQESKNSSDPNRRNGKTKKNVRSLQSGEFELESTRDRNGIFEPNIIAKRQLIITD